MIRIKRCLDRKVLFTFAGSEGTLSRREMLCARPPLPFLEKNFLSGVDSQRDGLIRA